MAVGSRRSSNLIDSALHSRLAIPLFPTLVLQLLLDQLHLPVQLLQIAFQLGLLCLVLLQSLFFILENRLELGLGGKA